MAWAAPRWMRPALASLALASIVASWLWTRERAEIGGAGENVEFAYPAAPRAATCDASASPHDAAPLRTAGGVALTVRAPSNYDPTYAHALLVVFAPAGADRFVTERFTGLTATATRAGFIVAYVDHKPLSQATIRDLGTVPAVLAQTWCIDARRIFLTGHSDGGTVATALAVWAEPTRPYAGIAPSAAGFTGADLAAYRCPSPLAVIVAHGAADELFPGFGKEAAAWWAACNKCEAAAPARRADGCVEYRGCATGARTVYCEHAARHIAWPSWNDTLIDFFVASAPSS
ncbi:MAG TPA: poly(3-hydroxybutyrate) depolymerase [Stellaceae bacterium]|nr:poly(3-hydroxybutyrate) depolymerase [Stellaceae bacterium]